MVITIGRVWEAGTACLRRFAARQPDLYGPVVAGLPELETRWPWRLRPEDEEAVDMLFAAAFSVLAGVHEREEVSRLYGEVMERMGI